MPGTYPRVNLFGTESRTLSSKIMGRNYQLSIRLPFDYEQSGHAYPVVYLLDSDILFSLLASPAFDLVYSEETPEFILVGIGYGVDTLEEWGAAREQDFLVPEIEGASPHHKAAYFLQFLEQELIPFVEVSYRADSSDRTLFGYSWGGFFVHYAWLKRPGLFRHYINSSGLDEAAVNYLSRHLGQVNPEDHKAPSDLFLTAGSLESDQLPAYYSYTTMLKVRGMPGQNVQTRVLDGQRHGMAAVLQTFMQGMRLFYRDWAETRRSPQPAPRQTVVQASEAEPEITGGPTPGTTDEVQGDGNPAGG